MLLLLFPLHSNATTKSTSQVKLGQVNTNNTLGHLRRRRALGALTPSSSRPRSTLRHRRSPAYAIITIINSCYHHHYILNRSRRYTKSRPGAHTPAPSRIRRAPPSPTIIRSTFYSSPHIYHRSRRNRIIAPDPSSDRSITIPSDRDRTANHALRPSRASIAASTTIVIKSLLSPISHYQLIRSHFIEPPFISSPQRRRAQLISTFNYPASHLFRAASHYNFFFYFFIRRAPTALS